MERPVQSSKAVFWQQVLDEHRQSNMTVAAFCSSKAISVQSFYQWRRKLQPNVRASAPQALVPVRLIPAVPQARSEPARSFHIMTPSGFSLRVDSSVDPSQLAKLLEAIELVGRGESC